MDQLGYLSLLNGKGGAIPDNASNFFLVLTLNTSYFLGQYE